MAAMAASSRFAIIGANVVDANWDGSPLTLAWHESAAMPQTTNGSMIVAWQNTATQDNAGTLALTTGGNQPLFFDAPAGALAPTILVQNWQANNLRITNLSANQNTPIWIEAYGPGLPGQHTMDLPVGPSIPVKRGDTLQGNAGGWMQLVLRSNSNELGLFAVVGGPAGASNSNAYVFAVNFPLPNTPPGYTQTTMTNFCTFQFNWANTIYVAYFGPGAVATKLKLTQIVTPPPTVTLLQL
jgi:hypothetical protein